MLPNVRPGSFAEAVGAARSRIATFTSLMGSRSQKPEDLSAQDTQSILAALYVIRFAGPKLAKPSRQKYSGSTTCHFLQRIDQCAVAIGRQSLQDLKKHSSAENHAANKNRLSGVSEAEERADDEKCNDVFKVSIGLHFWPQQKWRQLIIDLVDETGASQRGVCNEHDCRPGANGDEVRNVFCAHIEGLHLCWISSERIGCLTLIVPA
jgi:hypothetical protein